MGIRSRTQWLLGWRQLGRHRLATAGGVVMVAILLMAALAPVLAPDDPTRQDLAHKLTGVSPAHPLGTDAFGRDVLSRLIYGSRTAVLVGASTVLVALGLGVPLGLLSGFLGGRLDNAIMRVMDALLSFPAIMLALALMGVLGPRLHNVVLALGIVYTPNVARLARASTLAVREEEYVAAAQPSGSRPDDSCGDTSCPTSWRHWSSRART